MAESIITYHPKEWQKDSLPINTDLNDVTAPGFYMMYSDRNYVHAPAQYGLLIVINPKRTGAAVIFQIIIGSNSIYYRLWTSSWQDWRTFDKDR